MVGKLHLAALMLGVVLAGCAGSSLSKIEKGTELPKDLSQEVKEKFEVKDLSANPAHGVSTLALTPVQLETPLGKKNKDSLKNSEKKSRKKAKKSKLAETPSPASAQPFKYPNRRPPAEPIWIGEKLTYEVTYLGIPAGTFTLEALPCKTVGARKVYHIMAKAWNSAVFGLIYRVDDYVESFIDFEGFFSHRFHLYQDETKQIRDSLELYDSEKRQSYWWNRWDRKERGYNENKDFYPMDSFPQDTLSSVYYLRTVPLPTGGVVEFPVMSEGKPLTAYVTVIQREHLDTAVGVIKAIKLKPEAATRGVLERKGDSFMWISDDDRRFLLRIEAKVKIGTVVAQLKKLELGTSPH